MKFFIIMLISFAKSQICSGSDLLVDDFTVSRPNKATASGSPWNGDATTNFNVDVSKKAIIVQSTSASNWFTTDFNVQSCNDFKSFYGVSFDMIGPSTTRGSFTFTQNSPDCSGRIDSADSVALPITNYYKTLGVKSGIILPFADFSKTARGSDFDFVHLKGWVMINFNQNASFEFSNFKVLKCKPINTPESNPDSKKTSETKSLSSMMSLLLSLLI